ncbi:MAG: DPP IV N-terminal domain-containing protein [Gammaproteobacteria bacterium]
MQNHYRHLTGALFALSLAACVQTPNQETVMQHSNGDLLTNEAIFTDRFYKAEAPGTVRWLEDGSGFTTLETVADFEDVELELDELGNDINPYREIVFYDPETLSRTVLFSLAQLTPAGRAQALAVDDYFWSEDKSKLLIFANARKVWRKRDRGDYWLLNIATGELVQLGADQREEAHMMFGKLSPDAANFAYVWRDNIYVQNLNTLNVVALTTDASATVINGHFDWAYEEEFGIRDGFRWSPDSRRIAYWQLDTHAARDFFLINNTDTLYPVVSKIPYPKVGEENSAARIGVANIDDQNTVWIDLPGTAKDMYVPRMDWAENADELIIQQMNRKQDTNRVFYANVETGVATQVFVEREQTFIEDVFDPQWIEATDRFLWTSERSGWRHVYSVSRDGTDFVDLTTGEFDVVKMLSIEEDTGWLYFIASPNNVTQRYLYRSRLDGSGQMQRLTPEDYAGTNTYHVAKDSRWAIHRHASFFSPPVYRLVSLPDHKPLHVLEDNAQLAAKMKALALGDVEFFQVDAQDELTLDGYLLRPPQFDASKRYPIINFVYGEPAGQTVTDDWHGNSGMWHMLMSQRGFVISSVDNRGTKAPRGRDWRRSVYGGIGILSSRDQSDALTAMCKRWNFIDCDRVGIWGHSGGGSMTLNMMFRHPQQYHVGVSRAPVPDQRLYDSIYQERYSGLLDEFEEGYKQGSPITFASQLEGKLLLVHGTGDDNVHYQGAERLINELVKHNRQFDFFAYPNRQHGIRSGEGTELHLHTMMSNYFIEHLGRGEPAAQ